MTRVMGFVILATALAGCSDSSSRPPTAEAKPVRTFRRIAVVGASVSAGFGGTSVADALRGAAKDATIIDEAEMTMYQSPIAIGAKAIDRALLEDPDLVIGLDFLFWYEYTGAPQAERLRRLDQALVQLERIRTAGATLVVGDVPRFSTASELILDPTWIPSEAELAELNGRLRAWAALRDVVIVPFAEMCAPLATDGEIEVSPGERVRARELMALDGLHPNIFGTWYVMKQIDKLVETELGVAPDAWTFKRP
jgi:hypothetical protein